MTSFKFMKRKTVISTFAAIGGLMFCGLSAHALSVNVGASKESGVTASVSLGSKNSRSGVSVSAGGRSGGAGVSASVGSRNTGANVKARVGGRGTSANANVGLGRGSVNVSVSTTQARKIGSLSNLNKRQINSTMRGLGNTETVKLRKSCKAILATPVSYSPEAVQVCQVILEL